MNIIRKYYPFFIIILILFLTHINNIVNNNGLMIFYGDSYEQMLQFYLGGWERLRQLDFSQWDWSLGYGANYLSHVYYFATSPFFFITLFFDKAIIPYLFVYLNLLKLFLTFTFTFKWLDIVYKSKYISTIGSIVLTFSGWVVFYYHYNSFLDSFLLFPLILYGIENYLQNKKTTIYTLSLAALAIINYYFLYMFVPFIFFYTIFRYFVINRSFNFQSLWKSAFTFLWYSIIGIGLSSFILAPSIYILLQTPRLQTISDLNLLQTISTSDIYRFISTFFSPVIERFNPTYFISTNFNSGIGWGGGVSLYSFMLFPISFGLLLRSKDKFHRNAILIFYSLFIIMGSFQIFYRLLQGSYDVRWFYMITLLNVYTICYSLNDYLYNSNKSLSPYITSLLSITFIGILYFISFTLNSYVDLNVLNYVVFYIIILLLIYAIIIKYKIKKVLLLIVSLEAIIAFLIPLYFDNPIEKSQIEKYFSYTLNDDAIKYIQSIDNGFYRIISDNGEYISQNDPIARYYRGVSFYESIYNYETEGFINRFKSTWSMPITFGRYNTNFITSVKYFIGNEDSHLPPLGFEYLTTINNENIYINKYFIELGYTLDTTLNAKTFSGLPYFFQDQLFLNYIITEESKNLDFNYINDITVFKEWIYEDYYYLDFKQDIKNKIIYIENFDKPKFKVNLIDNGVLSKSEEFWQYNYFGIYFDDNSTIDAIELIAENIYNSSTGFNIYIQDDLSKYDEWYAKISQNTFKNVVINQDEISASLSLDKKQWIATSVPYDKGWTVKINGEPINFTKVNLGFIGFELEDGDYTLEMKYRSPFSNAGIILSFIAVIFFIISSYITGIRNRTEK